jgi:hypothetical protein
MPDTYLSPLWISLKTVLAATAITFFLGIAAARWMVGYRGRLKSVLDGLFILPLVLPPTVVGLGLLMLFGKHGPIGMLLGRLGAVVVFSWMATVISAVTVSFPLMYMTSRGAFVIAAPANCTVARLTGVRNLMEGVVAGIEDAQARVKVPGLGGLLKVALKNGTCLTQNQSVTVGIRPECISIAGCAGENTFLSRVDQAVEGVVGISYRFQVQGDEVDQCHLKANLSKSAAPVLHSGQTCYLCLPPERLFII